jgi:hypothetical protein
MIVIPVPVVHRMVQIVGVDADVDWKEDASRGLVMGMKVMKNGVKAVDNLVLVLVLVLDFAGGGQVDEVVPTSYV